MARLNGLRLLVLGFVIISNLAMTSMCFSADDISEAYKRAVMEDNAQDMSYLKGIDTIVVDRSFAPKAEKILHIKQYDALSTINEALKEVFNDQPWIHIEQETGASIDCIANGTGNFTACNTKDNLLIFRFIISARNTNIDGKVITLSSISLQIRQSREHNPEYAIPNFNASYPFVASMDQKILKKSN